MRLDPRSRATHVKLLVHGPPGAGRKTNLVHLRDSLPQRGRRPRRRGPVSYVDLDLGTIAQRKVQARCVCLPTLSASPRLRRAVIAGVDGAVFVADSSADRREQNIAARVELVAALETIGLDFGLLPHVYQWNKRDVRQPLSVRTLTQTLNPEDTESVSAIASSGIGVWRTWRRLIQRVFEDADAQRLTRAGVNG